MLRRLKDTASTRNIALYAVTILFAVSIAFAQPGQTQSLRLGNPDSRAYSGSKQFPNGLSQAVDKHLRAIAALPTLSVFSADSTFATNGSRKVSVSGSSGTLDAITGLAVQSDGKIVAAGYAKISNLPAFAVARFKTDGSLDSTFGTNGSKSVYVPGGGSMNDKAEAVAIQPADGKIVAAGSSKSGSNVTTFALMRFNTNGTVDNTFGTSGGVRVNISGGGGSDDEAYCLRIQSDGKIVAAGFTSVSSSDYIAVARFKANGAPDSTFGTNGSAKFAYGQAFGIAVQPDTMIVIGAQGFNAAVIGRLKTNGTADNSFGISSPGWTNTTSIGSISFYGLGAIALQSDGKIVAGGYTSSPGQFVVARYSALGALDASFGQSGAARTYISGGNQSDDEGYAMALRSDGNIVVAGFSNDASSHKAFAAARWSTGGVLQGSIRTSVSGGDGANDVAQAVAIDSSGRILVGGFSEFGASYYKAFGIARYNCPNSKVLTLSPAAAAETTATLSGEVLAGSPNTVVRFLYGKTSGTYTDSVTASTSPVNSSSTVSDSGLLNSLTMGSTYYYCIAASNAYTYLRGKEICFATSASGAGSALTFSPSSSTYTVHSSVITTITDNLTMEAWVKWNGGSGISQDILYNGDPASSGYGIYYDYYSGFIGILCGGLTFMHSDSVFTVGSWVHLAAVRQSGTWSWYINGVSQPISGVGTTPATPGVDFTVGGYKTREFFNGLIDEVRISDTIRYFGNFSPAHQAFVSDPHAIALYHFDEGAGTTAYDASGNANHLTLVNSPAWVTSDAPLPIQLAGFTANSVAITVNLEWQTISETNSLGFYVERSASKTGPFTAVSSLIVGAGTSLELHTYSYADNNVGSGTYYYRLHEVDKNGTGSYSSILTVIVGKNATGVREEEGLPTVFKLMQNYPNPFNPATEIKFWIKDASFTTLKVYNSIGQEVATLVNGMMQPGRYVATWNAGAMPSGVYIYRLESGKNVSVERMLMIK